MTYTLIFSSTASLASFHKVSSCSCHFRHFFQILSLIQGQLCGLCLWFLTKTENENDSANQNYIAKMTLQQALTMLFADGIISD